MNKKIKRHFVLQELDTGEWTIREFSGGSMWPVTRKPTAHDMLSRLAQLMNISTVVAQQQPEQIELTTDED